MYAWASIPRVKARTYFIGIVYHNVEGLSSVFLVIFESVTNSEVRECERCTDNHCAYACENV